MFQGIQELPSPATNSLQLRQVPPWGQKGRRFGYQREPYKNDSNLCNSFLPRPRAALINVDCIFFSRPSITSLSSLRLGSNEGFTRNSWFSTYKQNKELLNYTSKWVKIEFTKLAHHFFYLRKCGITDHPWVTLTTLRTFSLLTDFNRSLRVQIHRNYSYEAATKQDACISSTTLYY